MGRESLIQLVLDYLRTVTQLSDAQLRGYLGDWELVPFIVNNKIAGAVARKGTEVHFVLKKEARALALQKNRIVQFLHRLLEQDGYLTTRIMQGDIEATRFVERLGFGFTWTDGSFNYYMLDAPAYAAR
jgi:hypothetical protein